jgi:hypothetical protein
MLAGQPGQRDQHDNGAKDGGAALARDRAHIGWGDNLFHDVAPCYEPQSAGGEEGYGAAEVFFRAADEGRSSFLKKEVKKLLSVWFRVR